MLTLLLALYVPPTLEMVVLLLLLMTTAPNFQANILNIMSLILALRQTRRRCPQNQNLIYAIDYNIHRKLKYNPLKCSGIRWLHFKVFPAIQV